MPRKHPNLRNNEEFCGPSAPGSVRHTRTHRIAGRLSETRVLQGALCFAWQPYSQPTPPTHTGTDHTNCLLLGPPAGQPSPRPEPGASGTGIPELGKSRGSGCASWGPRTSLDHPGSLEREQRRGCGAVCGQGPWLELPRPLSCFLGPPPVNDPLNPCLPGEVGLVGLSPT